MVSVARWYIVSYRHPGGSPWLDYGEPISNADFDNVIRLVKQFAPFTEVRIKILDVKEND